MNVRYKQNHDTIDKYYDIINDAKDVLKKTIEEDMALTDDERGSLEEVVGKKLNELKTKLGIMLMTPDTGKKSVRG